MTTLPLPLLKESPSPVIRVSDLRQWVYCPRVIWWTHVCPVAKLESFKMKQGLIKERRLQKLQRRRTLRAFGLKQGQVESNVSLHSAELGLSGKLDMLIKRGSQRIPVEIKFTQGPARLNHRLQLAGYALLLEAIYGLPVTQGYVVRLPDDTADQITIDRPLRNLAWKTIAAIRNTILREKMPDAIPNIANCLDCEYLRFCGDIV